MKTVLHVGCGHKRQDSMPPLLRSPDWREIRLDLDPACQPDILASMTDMHAVDTSSVDAVYSVHNLEHLHPYDGLQALREFLRVLKDGGFAFIMVPNLELAAQLIAAGKTLEPAYQSPAGPVTPIDMIYGGVHLTRQSPFMQHRNGFTAKSLFELTREAGFGGTSARGVGSNVFAVAVKGVVTTEQLRAVAGRLLPERATA